MIESIGLRNVCCLIFSDLTSKNVLLDEFHNVFVSGKRNAAAVKQRKRTNPDDVNAIESLDFGLSREASSEVVFDADVAFVWSITKH